MVRHFHDFADLTARARNKDRDALYLGTWHARSVSEAIRTAEQVRSRDDDAVEAALIDLASDYDFKPDRVRKGYGTQYGEDAARADVVKQHDALVDALKKFRDLVDADLSALLQTELVESIERYQAVKAEIGRLDFVDLLVRARNLVRDHPQARAAFQIRFKRIFVDEFQDTDPLQAEILLLLCADDPSVNEWRRVRPAPGKLFIVGDPKQSIYRFRRADVAIYEEVKELLQARGARVVFLTSSFRAVPSLQRFVNAAFQPVMTGRRDVLQPGYVPLAPSRPETDDQPTVVAWSVPRPYGARAVTNTAIQASLPDAICASVAWLINESRWTVTERSTTG
jgi:ATP-dependent exoDNAse (exonuclease V) beta subunit